MDKLDNQWRIEKVHNNANLQVVTSLPAGMKFDRQQGKKFYDFYLKFSQDMYGLLKPGGFFISFSSPRLYHRMTSAMDDAGFEIRDSIIWLYMQSQAKAMSLNHFIERENISLSEKIRLREELKGFKTPQLKSCFELIAVAQKPTEGTYLENYKKWGVGLINTNIVIGDEKFPANVLSSEKMIDEIDRVFLVGKPDKKEKGYNNNHKTVKPLSLMRYLVAIFNMSKRSIVLDPFCGSGTTLIAAKEYGLNFIGIELNIDYVKIAENRLSNALVVNGRRTIPSKVENEQGILI